MRLFNVSTTDINNGQELADYVYRKYKGIDVDQDIIESIQWELLTEACQALNWNSIPQTGGFIFEFEE